jgi:hypothetical protein
MGSRRRKTDIRILSDIRVFGYPDIRYFEYPDILYLKIFVGEV